MLEKTGNLELTPEEQQLILSGVVPERIKQNWGDPSLEELLHIVYHQRTKGTYKDGRN